MNGSNRAHRAISHRSMMEIAALAGEQKRIDAADIILYNAEGRPVCFFTYTPGVDQAQVDRNARKAAKENGWRLEKK